MNYLKLGVISVIMIFLLFTGMSLFIPSHVRISRAVNLASTPEKIMAELNDTSQWRNWYPGFDEMKKAGTVISLIEKKENEISAEFNSPGKKVITSTWQAIPYTQSDSVTLQWYLHFKLRWYPWEKFGSLLYEKSYGQQMEAGLQNLKDRMQ
jgi:hypothetical protein